MNMLCKNKTKPVFCDFQAWFSAWSLSQFNIPKIRTAIQQLGQDLHEYLKKIPTCYDNRGNLDYESFEKNANEIGLDIDTCMKKMIADTPTTTSTTTTTTTTTVKPTTTTSEPETTTAVNVDYETTTTAKITTTSTTTEKVTDVPSTTTPSTTTESEVATTAETEEKSQDTEESSENVKDNEFETTTSSEEVTTVFWNNFLQF